MEFVEGLPLAAADNTRKLLDLAGLIADGMAAAFDQHSSWLDRLFRR